MSGGSSTTCSCSRTVWRTHSSLMGWARTPSIPCWR
jgi:hypothetical protein